jgi:hypothetical protein
MDPITAARNEYDAAKAAHDSARAAMVARTKTSGTYRHNPAELKAVDALHKVSSKKYQVWWQLSHAAA